MQRSAWEGVVRLSEGLGENAFIRLEPHEVARRSGSSVHREGVLDRTAATLHPGIYVRALRSEALKLGVKIFENTKVQGFSRWSPVVFRTSEGTVRAEKFVIANNAWAAGIAELRRSIVPITSDMVITAPHHEGLEGIGGRGERPLPIHK